MSVAFVHLSDIHFGQERDSRIFIHDDVKEQLIDDVRRVVSELPSGVGAGIIVTGDIAFAGKKEEYVAAAHWLDRVAAAIGCPVYQIQVVPGNHDIDRDEISGAMRLMFEEIASGGAAALDGFLNNTRDREIIYDRFKAYREFSEAYDCTFDLNGEYATDRRVELAPGRHIRFVRINSALLCSGKEKELDLLLGARQFVIPRAPGEEVIVLVHHPLHWYKDNADARSYVHSRVRVFISGHEHEPNVNIVAVEDRCDLMMLAAGATVPPKSDETYTYTYNVIEFDWDAAEDALAVTLHPRAWCPEFTRFQADEKRLGGKLPKFVLASPNFRDGAPPVVSVAREGDAGTVEPIGAEEPVVEVVPAGDGNDKAEATPMADGFQMVLFRFFRELTEGERLRVLVDLGAVTGSTTERLTQTIERRLLELLVKRGKLDEINEKIGTLLTERRMKGDE
jgi:predicted MPP superfamily phosphohydrolase